jgi:hypothetical protein
MAQRYPAGAVTVAAVLVLLGVGVWQLIQGGGQNVVSLTRSVAPFSAVELAGGNIVTVRVGAGQSVVGPHAQEHARPHHTKVLADRLVIADAYSKQPTKG